MPKSLEYRLSIMPATAESAWSAVLEGYGIVLRFSSLLELARYLELAALQSKTVEVVSRDVLFERK